MIKIYISDNNIKEKRYIIDIIFDEFLGLEYSIGIGGDNYEIILENGNKLVVEDVFFNKSMESLEYLSLHNIPQKIEYTENAFIPEKDIPIIFGSSDITKENNKLKCAIDIFASSFFMLTRWEEYVNKKRDNHNRFSAFDSLAYKHGFLERPIINEYVEMLWNMLKDIGISQEREYKNYKLYLTHDIDNPLKYGTFNKVLRSIGSNVLKNRDFNEAINNIAEYCGVLLGIKKDPFNTFNELMDISDSLNTRSHFFFMGKGLTRFDNLYKINDEFIVELVDRIKKRGHHIGIHPTYNASNNSAQFKKEKNEIENTLDIKIEFGRDHFLRFEVPFTWQIWEDNGMKWDSTLSYADAEGFRCGVCYEYSVFNFLTRQKLQLKEKPLIVMEGAFLTKDSNIEASTMELRIVRLIDKVKKYNGEFVFLWHNSSFNTKQWEKYQYIYKKVLFK